jgi:S-adenosylmethionine hydrolase
MKGVILGIAPETHIVDVTHDIPSYDISEAGFVIQSAYAYFPRGTVHVVVVDPGVGSSRRPIAAAVNGHLFVAPDNGVLSWVLESGEGIIHHITNARLFNPVVSQTFHGRDIFAPVAARLSRGISLDSVGPRIGDYIKDALPQRRPLGNNRFMATVLRIDKFGNAITNIRRTDLQSPFSIRLDGADVRRVVSNYSEAGPGEVFAIEGSTGYIELSLNQGSAAARFGLRRGLEIEVETEAVNH